MMMSRKKRRGAAVVVTPKPLILDQQNSHKTQTTQPVDGCLKTDVLPVLLYAQREKSEKNKHKSVTKLEYLRKLAVISARQKMRGVVDMGLCSIYI